MSLVAMLLRSRGGRVLVLWCVVGWLGWMAWGDAVAGYHQRLAELAHHGGKPKQHGRAPAPAPLPCRASRGDIPCDYLALYQAAARTCPGLSWPLLAGIGKVESDHGRNAATSSAGAEGPMQFLPGTWARYAVDGDGDGIADPQNLFDSTLSAARYLCSGGFNLRDPAQVMAAILRYNNSMAYAQNVLGWAAAYATGVVPVDLPPMTGPPPPLGNSHDEHPEGLGPGLPMNVVGLPANDPMRMPLIDLGQGSGVSQPTNPWAPQPAQMPGCTIICIGP
jgi:Transglycosylase SLT domain